MVVLQVKKDRIFWKKPGDAPFTVREEPKGTDLWYRLLYSAIAQGIA